MKLRNDNSDELLMVVVVAILAISMLIIFIGKMLGG